MMTDMDKAENSAPDSMVDDPQDVEITGAPPLPLSSFIGRERELGEIRSLLKKGKRLITLVGVGGIGKTRLALELAYNAGTLGWPGVHLAELASLGQPDLVEGAVLESVGGGSSRSPLKAAAEHLRGSSTLLVLDSCEHVLGAARRVAEALLRSCPSLAIVATSRSPLGIAGELVLSGMSLVRSAGNGRGMHATHPLPALPRGD